MDFKRGCGKSGRSAGNSDTPLAPDVGLGTRRRSRNNPKECGPAGNVIIVTCKQNIADLLGEPIRRLHI
jgi:hypothetical protein